MIGRPTTGIPGEADPLGSSPQSAPDGLANARNGDVFSAGDGAATIVERRKDILDAVAFAAGRFLAGDSFDDALSDVLARLGEASGASRVVLTERVSRSDRSYMRPRAEWDADGVRPLVLPTDSEGYEYFQRWETELGVGTTFRLRLSPAPPV